MVKISDFQWVKDHYFSDRDKVIQLKKGEVLLDYNQRNQRLFLVLRGKVLGFLKDIKLEPYPVFEATSDKLVGVYSYFSEDHRSYSRVVADMDTEVAYYDKPWDQLSEEESQKLMPFLTSVVVNELYSRQYFAKQMAKEKYLDVQKLLKAEKMATLGQMAAGLAHELNNSVGVINSDLDKLEIFISNMIKDKYDDSLHYYFQKGRSDGRLISTEEARTNRKQLEKHFKDLNPGLIKRLSKMALDPAELSPSERKNSERLNQLHHFWEAGASIHDMNIAAKHASSVVKSVKELGVSDHQWSKCVDVNETIKEALTITGNLTKRVETMIDLGEMPQSQACYGQLVQVWINIIKNGIESMIHASTPNPKLTISSAYIDESTELQICISDNGPGVPEEIKQKIFEPSFTTKVDGLTFGLGLGLSICQRIVTEHDGHIKVESTPGQTSFFITIPANI